MVLNSFKWLINTITTYELQQWFTEAELNDHHIFTQGHREVKDGKAVGIGTASITAVGHSWVVLFDKAKCEAFDTTFVKGFNDSRFTLKNCSGEAYENCTFKATDFSKVEAWDNAKGEKSGYSIVLKH